MKKVISIVFALCICTMMMAQSSFRKTLEEFQAISNASFAKEMLVKTFANIGTQKGLSIQDATAKAEKFVNEKMYPELLDMVEAEFKGKVSEDDLKELVTAYKTPAGQQALANSAKCGSSESQQALQKAMTPGVMAIIKGEKAEPVAYPACSDSYKKKFSQYYKLANLSEVLDATMNSLKNQLAQLPDAGAMVEKLLNFFTDNSEAILIQGIAPYLTEADLDFFNKALSTEAGKRCAEASRILAPKSAAYGVQCTQDFMNSFGQ